MVHLNSFQVVLGETNAIVGLPTQIIDQALPNAIKIPESDANREFFMDQAETMV